MKTVEGLLLQHLHIKQGKNKISELNRLIDEIARKENKSIETILNETLEELHLKGKDYWPFPKLKASLLKRRYPLTAKIDPSSVLLQKYQPLPASVKKRNLNGFNLKSLYIQEASAESSLSEKIQNHFPEIKPTFFKDLKTLFHSQGKEWNDSGKTRLILSNEKYDFFQRCPCTKEALMCNYYVISLGMGCPFDCSYCYLQTYQNLRAIILPTNPETYLEELSLYFEKYPDRILRIGTGEFSDSLALDTLTEYSKTLVPFFKDKNVLFELKTKSSQVQNLLNLDHGGKTVIGWSLNPEKIAQQEEWGAAPILDRLKAAQQCQEAGYPIAIHFDPIIEYEGWEKDYQDLIDQLYSYVKVPLQWISLGTLRFAPSLKPIAEKNHPDSRLYLGELFIDPKDRKMRYPKERRIRIYKKMVQLIQKHDPKVATYLCMEPNEVWLKVFDQSPFQGRIDQWICDGNLCY